MSRIVGLSLIGLLSLSPSFAQAEETIREAREEIFDADPILRPCCSLGYDLRVGVGDSQVAVKIDNIVNPRQIGEHSYRKQSLVSEQNGLLYTCRGGIIDIAHVRDNADRSAYLFRRLQKTLGSTMLLPVYDEGGKRYINLAPIPDFDSWSGGEKRELALLLAMRISFELSVWHELATWFGFASVPMYPEKVSAFSPEDLYSNILGVHLGAQALRSGGDYERAFDSALREALLELDPLPPAFSKRMLDAVDGVWWDSRRTLPDMRMVLRRNMDTASPIMPWLVADELAEACRGRGGETSAALDVPERGPRGLALSSLYQLRFYIDRKVMPAFPLPEDNREYFTEEDFAELISAARREIEREFGPFATSSGMTAAELGLIKPKNKGFDPAKPCGGADPDCAQTRRDAVQAVKIGEMAFGGGNYAGFFYGGALARLENRGGGFKVFRVETSYDARNDDYTLFLGAAATDDVLLFCSVEADDGSGRSRVDFPFVNPFASKCLSGSWVGLKLSVLEWYRNNHARKSALRPLDVGIGFNPLANGHSTDYLTRHLLITVGFTPESIYRPGNDIKTFRIYSSLIWHRLFLDDRLGLRAYGQIRANARRATDFMGQSGLRLYYNHLWNHADLRGGTNTLHHLFTFGLEASATYWNRHAAAMPGLEKFYIDPADDLPPHSLPFNANAMFYIETAVPTLGLF